MAITTEGKLLQMTQYGKTDDSIHNEYLNLDNEYKKIKETYKISREEYKLAKEKLTMEEKRYDETPFLKKIFSEGRKLRKAQQNVKLKKQQLKVNKQKFKAKLKELKSLKKEVRTQYKNVAERQKFFNKVKQAEKMGIQLPKYIIDEYNRQQNLDLSQKYSVDEKGKRTYISASNKDISKDVSSLIWEKRKRDLQNTIDKFRGKDKQIDQDEGR